MKNLRLLLYFLLLFINSSCLLEQTESIDPLDTFSEADSEQSGLLKTYTSSLLGENQSLETTTNYYLSTAYPESYVVKVRYKLSDMDVYGMADLDGSTLEILSNSLIRFFAKLYFNAGGTYSLDMDYFVFDFPEINIDRELINEIRITKAEITYSDKYDHYDFEFIDSLAAYVPKYIFSDNEFLNFLMFDYKKSDNKCDFRCISFNIYADDALYYFNKSNFIRIAPKAVVSGLPEKELFINGEIELAVSIKLPF